MEAKHTPTPWSANVVVSDGGGWKNTEQYVTIGADDVCVAYYSTSFAEFPPDEVNKANADFIVRAVNSHDALVEALRALLNHVDRETCVHETTHRGGAIWTICDGCGMKWADDRGGFVPHTDAVAVAQARAALALAGETP